MATTAQSEATDLLSRYVRSLLRDDDNSSDAIAEEIRQRLECTTPIPVSERLPNPLERVLALHDKESDGWITACIHEDGEWWEATEYSSRASWTNLTVTHWLPLPPVPA